MPYRSGLPSFIIPRSNRLRRIFDHMDAFAFNNFHNRVHFGALAEQMDGHYRFCPRSDFLTYLGTVEVESFWIDIHKNRTGTEPCDHAGGGKERVSRSDHFVSRSASRSPLKPRAGHQSRMIHQWQSVHCRKPLSPVPALHFRPQDEVLRLDNSFDRLADFRPDS